MVMLCQMQLMKSDFLSLKSLKNKNKTKLLIFYWEHIMCQEYKNI